MALFRRLEKYSWNEHYALTAINKQMQLCPMDVREKMAILRMECFSKGFFLEAAEVFFTLPKGPSNVVTIILIPTTRLPLRHSYMFPNHFSSVHHAGFDTPWSTGIFWSFLFIVQQPDVVIH